MQDSSESILEYNGVQEEGKVSLDHLILHILCYKSKYFWYLESTLDFEF